MDRSYIDTLKEEYSTERLLSFGGFGDMLNTVKDQGASFGADKLLESAGGLVGGAGGGAASGAMSGLMSGGLGKIAGGPWGMAADAAGMIMSAAAPKLTANTATSTEDFDFGADLTASQGEKFDKRNAIMEQVGSIPVVGKLASGMGTLLNGLLTKKQDSQDKVDEFATFQKGETADAKAGLYADAFGAEEHLAACGGLMRKHAMGGNTGEPYTIDVGGSHEQNPQNGVTISPGNKAEEGEVIVDLPKGQFVFTDRF